MNALERRCIDISHKFKLTHLSSVLTSVNIIDKIYSVKKDNEPFILSNGHAALALYVVLEKYFFKDAEALYKKHGTHPNRDAEDGIWCSTGSLGHGITVAVGMAAANRSRSVYVLSSDGEMAEGSCWEALKIAADLELENLKVSVICNGFSAYKGVDRDLLDLRLQMFYPSLAVRVDMFSYPDWLQGIQGHYIQVDDEKYDEITAES